MAQITERRWIKCDSCYRNVELVRKEHAFGYIEFLFPWKWWIFKSQENKGFCSWKCVRDYAQTKLNKGHEV